MKECFEMLGNCFDKGFDKEFEKIYLARLNRRYKFKDTEKQMQLIKKVKQSSYSLDEVLIIYEYLFLFCSEKEAKKFSNSITEIEFEE